MGVDPALFVEFPAGWREERESSGIKTDPAYTGVWPALGIVADVELNQVVHSKLSSTSVVRNFIEHRREGVWLRRRLFGIRRGGRLFARRCQGFRGDRGRRA